MRMIIRKDVVDGFWKLIVQAEDKREDEIVNKIYDSVLKRLS